MAVDLFAPAGTPVYAPFDGVVERRENRANAGRLRRAAGAAPRGAVLDAARAPRPGDAGDGTVRAGEEIARLGAPEVNGGWEPHMHLQLFTDLVGDLDGVALPEEADLFRSVCPDPNLLLGLPGGVDARAARPDIAERRRTVMSRALSLAYTRAAAHRPRARRVPLRRRRPAVPRPRQQRRARRPLPSARGGGGCAADGGAEHEHALPAPLGDRLRAGAGGDAAGPAARVLLRELGLGGERPGAAAGVRAHRSRRRDRARPRLPRAPELDDRDLAVQGLGTRGRGSPRCRPSRARWSRCAR